MKVKIMPSKISGMISAPPSKSYTHRAIILATLADGKSVIKNALISDDTKATINAARLLGAKINLKGEKIIIEGVNGHFPKKKSKIIINCGLSGTTIRLMTAVSALSTNEVILTGDKRLSERPLGELVKALKFFGVNISADKDDSFPPVKVKGGNFGGGKMKISGEISSQFVSALLLISPFAKNYVEISVENLKSEPYVNITIALMKTFGVEVQKNENTYFVKSGQRYKAIEYTVEGDYSSASYFFAAAAVTGSKLTINNLRRDSVQGDKYFLAVLKKLLQNNTQKININLGNYPDIVPTVSVVAAKTKRITTITNIGHLRLKETDRIKAIAHELRKMNIDVKERTDSLCIVGGKLMGAQIETYNDHRIAMSFAVAGLVAKGVTIINNAEVVNKSYPNFWKDLKKIGAKIKFI